MMQMAVLGFVFGIVIASGVVAFIISLGIVPRYAGITRTARRIPLYEDCSMAGAFLGNLLFLYPGKLLLGWWGLTLYGVFSGIFLGSWVVALGETVDIFAVLARRLGITRGIGMIILSMALGKSCGSLLYYWMRWGI